MMTVTKQKKKPTNKEITEVINNDNTSENLAKQTGYSQKTIQKEVKKGKLNLGFVPDSGDSQPPPIQEQDGVQTQQPVQIDYEATARGFITFIDMMLWFVAKISQGNLEYEKLNKDEIETCTQALKTETKALEILASQGWALHAIVIFQVVGVFSTKLKMKKKPKKPDNVKKKDGETTKKIMKIEAIKKVSIPKGQATEVSTEVEIDQEPFLETDDVGNIDGSTNQMPIQTEYRDENYGKPNLVKGKIGIVEKK